jgi:hypothetical protein
LLWLAAEAFVIAPAGFVRREKNFFLSRTSPQLFVHHRGVAIGSGGSEFLKTIEHRLLKSIPR